MVKKIILLISFFLISQAYGETITDRELNKYQIENLKFNSCKELGIFYNLIATEYYRGNIENIETDISRYKDYSIGFLYKNAIDLVKRLPEVRNEEEKKIMIKNFEVKAFNKCVKDQELEEIKIEDDLIFKQ